MPLAQSPKRLTLICSKYYGIALAMTNWKFGQVGKKKKCVCASLAPPSLAPEILKLICSSWLGVALQINDLTVLLI